MGLTIKSKVRLYTDLAFELFDELVKDATFRKVTGYTLDPLSGKNVAVYSTSEVGYIRTHYRSEDVDGQTVIYGDERWLVKASELLTVSPQPSSGDSFESVGNVYDVQAALLDPTENLWVFQVRRNLPDVVGGGTLTMDDWGDLTAAGSTEDWGDLTVHNTAEDWNS